MHPRRGFTLVELLVVVLIISVLAAIGLNRVWKTKEKAYVASMVSDLRTMVTAQEDFRTDSSRYTADFAQLSMARRSAGVEIVIEAAGDSSWRARSNHPGTATTCLLRGGVGEPSGDSNVPICG